MPFKVAARAVLELGAELISSDEIAIYELVKNAFDAGSPDVEVSFRVDMRRTEYETLAAPFEPRVYEDEEGHERYPTPEEVEEARLSFAAAVREARRRLDELGMSEASVEMSLAAVPAQAAKILRSAYVAMNRIVITDTGHGMTLETLDKAFLTIGTPYRHNQRERQASGSRKILGEKGVGRLSAMRLGSLLDVTTATADDVTWNRLSIDWDDFAVFGDELVGDVPVAASKGGPKPPGVQGTSLIISGLETDWTKAKLEQIAVQEFSRISDPFAKRSEGFPLKITFNDEPIALRRLSSELFKHAHGYCEGRFVVDKRGKLRFEASFEYRLYNEHTSFRKDFSELADAITQDVPSSALRSLGDFSFQFYWFNRQLLRAIDGIGNVTAVRRLVNSWSGGLMVFRDGFRVNPYGGPGDDWLELNKQAFKSSGYLLNTDQIVGRVQIDSEENPRLVDQTNREGLRDTFEFQALKNLMRHFFTVDLKKYIDRINEEYAGLKGIDLRAVERNVLAYEKRVERNINQLKKVFPGQEEILAGLREDFQAMRHAYNLARDKAQKSEENGQRLLDLAGIGLLVEVVSHELARATQNTLELVTSARRGSVGEELGQIFNSLEAQLQTITRRLRVLDPLSISGRQRRSRMDLAEVVGDVFAGRTEELEKHGIRWSIEPAEEPVRIQAVKGMIYQIVENLLSNSIHWLNRAREERPQLRPVITVSLDNANGGGFTFFDNGPGISASLADVVFDPFFTTRGESGRGLGLFIVRENARHHGGDIALSGLSQVHPNRFNSLTFRMVADEHD